MKPEEVELTPFQKLKVFLRTINSFFPRLNYMVVFFIAAYIAYKCIFNLGENVSGVIFSVIISSLIGIISSFVIVFFAPEIMWKEMLKPSLKEFKETWETRYEVRKYEEQEESLKKIDEIILKK